MKVDLHGNDYGKKWKMRGEFLPGQTKINII